MVMKQKICAAALFILTVIEGYSQSSADTASVLQKFYTLGEVLVSATVDKTTVRGSDMQKYNAKDVSSALRTLPSLVISGTSS